MSRMLLFLLLISSVVFAGPLVVYSNLGPGDSYDPFTGWTVGYGYAVAMPFTPSADATLDSIELPLWNSSGAPDMTLALMTDIGGLPGGVLESFTLQPPFYTPSLLTATSLLHPLLEAGSTYWLAATPVDWQQTVDAWNWNNTAVYVDFAVWNGAGWEFASSRPDYGTGLLGSAFRVNGEASGVPEPATLGLFGAALIGLGLLRRRPR